MDERNQETPTAVWRERFLSTTRGRLINLLRAQPLTPGELAERLRISPNAARGHLASLERDGLVEVTGVRRDGPGKPPRVYAATPAAEELFPKAYEAVLSALLDVLEDRVGEESLASILRDVGKHAGRGARGAEDPLEKARLVLGELGAEIEVEVGDEGTWLRGRICPLAGLVGHRPELCGMLAALLAEVIGAPVREHCSREEPRRPRCAFLAVRSTHRG